ncbi:MAG TPA: hypothetical protein VKC58_02380 [Myxococcales bacterium]|nr:hypothetical protein [Myxococcales bacterium]
MIEGLVLAAGSALLGGALALLARRRASLLELTRTFAFTAAAGVVAFHLLPEVLPALGPTALLWIAAGFVLPWLLEVGARALGPDLLARWGIQGMRVAAEVGFAALIFHSLFEGLALLAALQGRENRTDLEIAIVAHHAPLTAAVALPFLDLLGVRATLIRVGLVALAGGLGVVFGNLLPGLASGADTVALQRATAVTAGALLHVVADEIREQRFTSVAQRALDLLAAAAGLSLVGLAVFLDVRTTDSVLRFFRTATALALGVAPALVASMAAEVLERRHTLLHRLRAPFDGLFATGALLGWPAAAIRAALTAVVAAPRLLDREAAPGPPPSLADDLARRGPWLVALLFLAASVDVLAPPAWFATLGPGGIVVVAVSLAVAARASASGAALVACALVHRGLPAGMALPFLALGALPLRRAARFALFAVAAFAVALAAGAALERVPFLREVARTATSVLARANRPVLEQLAAAPAGTACMALLVALALALALRSGVRGWFAPFRHANGHDHEAHAHEHAPAAAR